MSFVVQLPRAPEAMAAQAAAEAARAEAAACASYEADVAAVRQLRMTLREIAMKLLCDRRWRVLAAPVSPEEDPNYWERVSSPHPSCHPVDTCSCWGRSIWPTSRELFI